VRGGKSKDRLMEADFYSFGCKYIGVYGAKTVFSSMGGSVGVLVQARRTNATGALPAGRRLVDGRALLDERGSRAWAGGRASLAYYYYYYYTYLPTYMITRPRAESKTIEKKSNNQRKTSSCYVLQ
jgi:hypothetical protein